MRNNKFTQALFWVASRLRKSPFFSTSIAAVLLSTIWAFAWFVVFLATTLVLDLSTSAFDLILVFWASIAAEALIRWAENTRIVALLSKPHEDHPKGDNQDYRLLRAFIILISIFAIFVIYLFVMNTMADVADIPKNQLIFRGLQGRTQQAWGQMWAEWKDIAKNGHFIIPIFGGTLMRSVIYKRSHNGFDHSKTPFEHHK